MPEEGVIQFTDVAPVLPSLIESTGNYLSTRATNKANKEENDKTRAYNLELWNMQNAYNLPVNQMKRLKDAGLNVNLMYGKGDTGSAAPPSPASPTHYNAPQIDLNNAIMALLNYKQVQNQAEINEALKYETGIKQQEYIRAYQENALNYGQNSVTPHGRGKYGWVSSYTDAENGLLNNTQAGKERLQKLENVRLQNSFLNSQRLNTDEMTRLRKQEAEMNSVLKPFFMTASDPLAARLMLFVAKMLGNTP